MINLKERLVNPNENSNIQFQPFYHITPKELREILAEFHLYCTQNDIEHNIKFRALISAEKFLSNQT